MKEQKFGPLPLYGLTLGGGIFGFILRLLMLKLGYDRHGVQLPGHWTYMGLWLLALAVLAGLFVICRGMGQRNGMEENFPASLVSCLGTLVAAGMLFVSFLPGLLGDGTALDKISAALGLGGALALGFAAYLRKDGQGSTAALLIVTVSLAAHLIASFRVWSTDPLLGDFCFRLLGSVFAMLAAYQLSGFPIGKGSRRASLFCSCACLFFSVINLADGGLHNLLFFGGMGIWQLVGSCSPEKPRKPRRKLGGGIAESEEKEP